MDEMNENVSAAAASEYSDRGRVSVPAAIGGLAAIIVVLFLVGLFVPQYTIVSDAIQPLISSLQTPGASTADSNASNDGSTASGLYQDGTGEEEVDSEYSYSEEAIDPDYDSAEDESDPDFGTARQDGPNFDANSEDGSGFDANRRGGPGFDANRQNGSGFDAAREGDARYDGNRQGGSNSDSTADGRFSDSRAGRADDARFGANRAYAAELNSAVEATDDPNAGQAPEGEASASGDAQYNASDETQNLEGEVSASADVQYDASKTMLDPLFRLRVTGLVLAIVLGAIMALCGAVFRGALASPLTTPTTLGLFGGAALGISVWMLAFGPGATAASSSEWLTFIGYLSLLMGGDPFAGRIGSMLGMAGFAFVGMLVVMAVLALVRRVAGANPPAVAKIALGQAAGVVCALAAVTICAYLASGADTVSVSLGSLFSPLPLMLTTTFYQSYDVPDMATFTALGLFASVAASALIARADDSLPLRLGALALASFAVALAVSYCGFVGFLGFMAVTIAQYLVGTKTIPLLVSSALAGALIVLLVQVLLGVPLGFISQMATGFVVSLVGAVFFLVYVLRGKAGHRG